MDSDGDDGAADYDRRDQETTDDAIGDNDDTARKKCTPILQAHNTSPEACQQSKLEGPWTS